MILFKWPILAAWAIVEFLIGAFALKMDFPPLPGFISFIPVGKCATGNPSYVGLISPHKLTKRRSFFIELSGGAACFNKSSCEDSSLRRWTDVEILLREFLGVSESEFTFLKSGTPLPLSFMAKMKPGWIPGQDEFGAVETHPLMGMKGVFVPSCTADIAVGRTDSKYEDTTWFHHGGIVVRELLTAVARLIPDIEDFYIYGGSGGGVAAAAWMMSIADTFPKARVLGLVDSGFHMMPGTELFKFFYHQVSWSHGPGERKAEKVYTNYQVPTFDWLSITSIARVLATYKGRIKIAYLGCAQDTIVYSDRQLMGKYTGVYNDTKYAGRQVEEMWNFLSHTHKCAPPGTVFSWVADCKDHHLTLNLGPEWAKIVAGEMNKTGSKEFSHIKVPHAIGIREFVYNFLEHKTVDPVHKEKYRFWYDNRTKDMEAADCSDIDNYDDAAASHAVSSRLPETALPYVAIMIMHSICL